LLETDIVLQLLDVQARGGTAAFGSGIPMEPGWRWCNPSTTSTGSNDMSMKSHIVDTLR
jgi:hypothetical protein